jgi:uncharacterized membrane-anchored protein YjiN (DUF445 family)
MVRAGLVRQLAAGIYVFLPVGWRVMQKIAAIIRDEMNGIGGQEMLMPVINSAEIWQQSRRWYDVGDELFRLKDRRGSDMALAMTHEEVVAWLAAREIQSYKQLPQIWYHIQTKERDEARPELAELARTVWANTRSFIERSASGETQVLQHHLAGMFVAAGEALAGDAELRSTVTRPLLISPFGRHLRASA